MDITIRLDRLRQVISQNITRTGTYELILYPVVNIDGQEDYITLISRRDSRPMEPSLGDQPPLGFGDQEYYRKLMRRMKRKVRSFRCTEGQTCPICLEEGDKVYVKSKCKHTFHEECILQSLVEHKYECPVCRCDHPFGKLRK